MTADQRGPGGRSQICISSGTVRCATQMHHQEMRCEWVSTRSPQRYGDNLQAALDFVWIMSLSFCINMSAGATWVSLLMLMLILVFWIWPPNKLGVDSQLVDFGLHVVGQTISRTITLTNKGALATHFSLDTSEGLSAETSQVQMPSQHSTTEIQVSQTIWMNWGFLTFTDKICMIIYE